MRGWLLLAEVAVSIIILVTFYFYSIGELRRYNIDTNIMHLDEEEFRGLDFNCENHNEYIYYITNFSDSIFCYKGNRLVNIPDNVSKVFEYFYSGKNTYEPFVIVLYK